eukprot:m.167759 g.167759  ORF g.167759 m.167759 type:complete len:52 (+) comp14467_c0_seq4:963-1118(+)
MSVSLRDASLRKPNMSHTITVTFELDPTCDIDQLRQGYVTSAFTGITEYPV